MSNEVNNQINEEKSEEKVSFFSKFKAAFAAFYANKKLFITVTVCLAVLLAVGAGVLITVLTDESNGDTPNTGEIIEGTYSMSAEAGAFAAGSTWAFDGNFVTNTYNDGEQQVTVNYQYVIAIEKGEKVIKLTTTPEGGSPVTTTHLFETGSITKDGVTRPIIFINGVQYTGPAPSAE